MFSLQVLQNETKQLLQQQLVTYHFMLITDGFFKVSRVLNSMVSENRKQNSDAHNLLPSLRKLPDMSETEEISHYVINSFCQITPEVLFDPAHVAVESLSASGAGLSIAMFSISGALEGVAARAGFHRLRWCRPLVHDPTVMN